MERTADLAQIYEQIASAARRMGADRATLYGSRARGDNRARSDIDIAVFGLPEDMRNAFMEMIDSLPTLLDFDVVFITGCTSPELLANIEKDGVVLMDKFAEKYDKLTKAVVRLREALEAYAATPSDIVRDGVIQRFEFCTELSWKTLREYLADQGYADVNSPKAVIKQAYADGIITDGDAWVSLLNDRNRTAHIYDEATAQEILERIRNDYVELFSEIVAKYSDK